jgi:hypothetical protein
MRLADEFSDATGLPRQMLWTAWVNPDPKSRDRCSDWHNAVSHGSMRGRSLSGPAAVPDSSHEHLSSVLRENSGASGDDFSVGASFTGRGSSRHLRTCSFAGAIIGASSCDGGTRIRAVSACVCILHADSAWSGLPKPTGWRPSDRPPAGPTCFPPPPPVMPRAHAPRMVFPPAGWLLADALLRAANAAVLFEPLGRGSHAEILNILGQHDLCAAYTQAALKETTDPTTLSGSCLSVRMMSSSPQTARAGAPLTEP